jgi:hypothetical protein
MMRSTIFAGLLAAAASLALADVSGDWKLEGEIAGVRINRTCALKQEGSRLSGKCKGAANEVELSGEVAAKNVTWKYDTDYMGTKLTLTYQGILESETTIKGTIAAAEVTGSFTATKQ